MLSEDLAPDLAALWPRVDEQLRDRVTDHTYALWLARLEPLSLEGDELLVHAPTEVRAWVTERFARTLHDAAAAAAGKPLRVRVVDAGARHHELRAPVLPTAHANVRVPVEYLSHWPVERDPHAHTNWRGSGVRRWEHVGADVEVDHVSSPLHARVMIAVAACLQGGINDQLRIVLRPHELLRAGGLRRPGGRDVRDLLRVLADWNASTTLTVTRHVPRWEPRGRPRVVIDGPPARGSVVTSDGEVLDPAQARHRGVEAAAIVGIVLDVDERFARLMAAEQGCRLLSRETLQLVSARELVPYMRHQAIVPRDRARSRYTGWPWLQQLGLHGRVDPALEEHDDQAIARAARRTRKKAQRRMEQDLRDDLHRLCELDAGYAWVRIGDGGNGCASVRVGVAVDEATGRRLHGPAPGAASLPRLSRREWRRHLVARGKCDPQRRTFTVRGRRQARGRLRGDQDLHAVAWRAPRRSAPQLLDQAAANGPPAVP